jgi:hypothetical protein
MRRLVELVFEENRMPTEIGGEKSKVLFNIGLKKVHSQLFKQNQRGVYDAIVGKLREMLREVL